MKFENKFLEKLVEARYLLNTLKKGCLILLVVAQCAGCKKWLSEKPSGSIATPETLTDLQAMLDNKTDLNEQKTPSMPEASADDYFELQSVFDFFSGTHAYIAPYIWDKDPYATDNDWKSCYLPVYVANLCLERVSGIQRTSANAAQWNNITGSALFFRSYYFLMLSWTYSKAYDAATADSDLGIVLRLTSDINVPSVRASVRQSYEQIISDAKSAVQYLPDVPVHCLHPSKAATYGLLARTYLSMRQYDSALKYADQSLQIYNQLMDYNNDPDIISSFSGSGFPFRKYNKEIIFYTGMNIIYPTPQPQYARIDSVLYTSYESDDLRKIAFFNAAGSYQSFKGNYTPETGNFFTGIATDEMLLIRAECLARRGDKDAALADLDTLLVKRWRNGFYHQASATTAAEALAIILKERRKELLMRGLRWMDLKRLNKEGANDTLKRVINGQTYLLPPNDNRYAQPLPQEIIDLTGMPQNPR